MRLILKCLAVLILILVIAAAVFYEVYLKVGQYSYTGTPPSPPSRTWTVWRRRSGKPKESLSLLCTGVFFVQAETKMFR